MSKDFICDERTTVKTCEGLLRGYRFDHIYHFLGVKYADAARWQMPTPVKPWEGVKDVQQFGCIAPQLAEDRPDRDVSGNHIFYPQNEDCQFLNIWTNSIEPGVKKPVMFWIHGGGFMSGSSIEQSGYLGKDLADWGDVVVVSVNHRLNIFGYLDLADFGEKYKNSGNAGMADLVEALRWVKRNIASFGGDPDNVTIFGQSGGGGKVNTLLQIPEAAGLFHKAIVQSGVLAGGPNTEAGSGKKIADFMINAIHGTGIESLLELSTQEIKELFNYLEGDMKEAGINTGWAPLAGDYFVGYGDEVGFTDFAKTVPTMIGSCIGEFAFMKAPFKRTDPEDVQIAGLKQKYGNATEEIVSEYRKVYPGKDLYDLYTLDTAFRCPTVTYCEKKSAESSAPVFNYMFALDFPFNGGTPATHCSEIVYIFHNADNEPYHCIEGVSDKLQDQISGAWVNFAKNGDPNNDLLPVWKDYRESAGTMILDRECRLTEASFDSKLLKLVLENSAMSGFHFPPKPKDGRKLYIH